jgi:hypothetical protein
MTRVDQFESAFKAASKTLYEHRPISVRSVLVLTDLDEAGAEAFGQRAKAFLRVLDAHSQEAGGREVTWTIKARDAFENVRGLLALVEEVIPDLVITYRSLHSQAWPWTTTLGRYVDVLAQEVPMPVLLLPNPHAEAKSPESFRGGKPRYEQTGTGRVMALTSHLTGEHRLVNQAAFFTEKDGSLFLVHVEDDHVFARYMDAISKIPAIDTETARETILERLLTDPMDYIRSCAAGLKAAGVPLQVEEIVVMGHHLREVRRIVEEQDVNLLVLHTKDEDQLAMHGLAYPLVVELRHLPILML